MFFAHAVMPLLTSIKEREPLSQGFHSPRQGCPSPHQSKKGNHSVKDATPHVRMPLPTSRMPLPSSVKERELLVYYNHKFIRTNLSQRKGTTQSKEPSQSKGTISLRQKEPLSQGKGATGLLQPLAFYNRPLVLKLWPPSFH